MIGPALVAYLSGDAPLTGLIADRIAPARFGQAEKVPGIVYGTDTIKPLNCRGAHKTYMGTLEIGIMAATYLEMQSVLLSLRRLLDSQQITAQGVTFTTEDGEEKPDETTEKGDAFYKQIDFAVYATLT